jgi:hypothetical protein
MPAPAGSPGAYGVAAGSRGVYVPPMDAMEGSWPTGWCWPGFLCGPIWGLFHGQIVIGIIGLLLNCGWPHIYFGLQGHQLASSGYGGTAAQYRAAQRGWIIAWFIVLAISVALWFLCLAALVASYRAVN